MPLIQVKGLTKVFREVKAVDGLSFSVNEGDVYGFLGQNGAGKSTTIRMLLTLVAPTEGDIEVFGMDLRHNRKAILRQVGAIIERPDLYSYLSGFENLALFAKLSGMRPSRRLLMEQLDSVGLAEREASKVSTYSQGMKQRLGIAVALVHDPALIILDEPTNGLDPQGIADMRSLVRRLSGQMNKTLLVSSHILNEIEQVASRILIIDRGRKVAEGNAEELMHPGKTIVEVTVTDIRDTLQKLALTAWQQQLKEVRDSAIVLQVHREDLARLNRELVQMGIGVTALQPRHSLEDYFLSLTGENRHVAAITN